jgi:hypothetical protein
MGRRVTRSLVPLLLAGLCPVAHAATPGALSCVEALEQVLTLKTAEPVYQEAGGDERHFINDSERPAELARLDKIIARSCSSDRQARAAQDAEAQRLHVALSPQCAVARDELAAMQQPRSRVPRDVVATKRQLVESSCPPVDTAGRWLVQWNGRGDLTPH